MQTDPHQVATPRLLLQPVRPADASALHQHWTDAAVRRYLWDDLVISRPRVDEIVVESERLFETHGYGLWAIRLPTEADLIGCGGYWTFHEPSQLELVLSLSPAWWGRGLAAEAGAALLDYASEVLGMDEVRASTDAPNAASRRLAERLGFTRSHRAVAKGLDTVFFVWRPTGSRSRS